MRRALIDTNVYSAFKRGDATVTEAMRHLDFIGMNITVLGELYAGFKGSQRNEINRRELEEFMNSSRVHLLENDRETADFYATIFNGLKKNGTPIPTNDIWIASSAIQNGLSLLSLDKHFSYVEGLILFNIEAARRNHDEILTKS